MKFLFVLIFSFVCVCIDVMAAGEEDTTSSYKKVLPETSRESMKFSNPKYSSILRGTESNDSRRLGLDIVKKSNDHLEKQTAPNSMSRVIPGAADSETNRSTTVVVDSVQQQKLHLDDFNASRNARDLSYDKDTIASIANGSTARSSSSNSNNNNNNNNNSATNGGVGGVTLNNDTVYLVNPASISDNASVTVNTNTNTTSTSITNNNSSSNAGSAAGSINKTIFPKGTVSTSTVSTAVLKNPKDNENKTKIDSNSTFAKKVTINVKAAKNATSGDNTTTSTMTSDKPSPKISGVLVVNETHLENSTDYISDQWNLNETSHNYNVTEDNSKNITLLSKCICSCTIIVVVCSSCYT